MRQLWMPVVAAAVVLALGVALGMFLNHHDHADETPEDDHAHGPELSAQTMQNLGIELRNLGLGSYVRYTELQGELVDAPLNRRIIRAPVAGVITGLQGRPGDRVAAGAVLLEMLRDALPRPELKLTAPVFAPINEDLHRALGELRSAQVAWSGLGAEIRRIEELNAQAGGAPLVSGRRLVELRLQFAAARQRLGNARIELEHHGFNDAEIDAVLAGGHPERGPGLWQRALQVHGLWSKEVAAIRKLLPEQQRDLPWTLAVLGELSAAGLVDATLVAAMAAEPELSRQFMTSASLLMRGEPVARLRWLAGLGALGARFKLAAPTGAEDWDVLELHVQPGQRVAAGEPLFTLHNPRKMWLQVEAVGQEVKILQDFARGEEPATARALIADLLPDVTGLRPLLLRAGESGGATQAVFALDNKVLVDGVRGRSWQLRSGMRFALRIPRWRVEDKFVLPRSAVLSQGADQVVFLPDGDTYKALPVRVLHSDEEFVVIESSDGVLSPGILLIHRGALALSLALQAGEGEGHHHHHH